MSDVLVIGAGVCGLTSAICLAEAGLDVTVQTASLPLDTTSVAAGAIWGPHLVEASERVDRWSRATLATLRELAGQPATGIEIISGGEASRDQAGPPDWADLATDFTPWPGAQLPAGFVTGWRYSAPVLDMPVYLGYLLDRFTGSGGEVRLGAVGSLTEALSDCPVVVNCTGIGARTLVPDPDLQPVRGQAVIVANPGIEEFFIGAGGENGDLVYFFPHGGTVLLGGTEQHGNPSLDPDPETTQTILAGCAAIEPRLAGAGILAERVGLRPFRPQIRFGAEHLDDGRLLWHNYGHGGAGITLSWACAHDITEHLLHRT
ncbi:MAG TPA: FAD-dependent oxidoreductase [Streptosporangiaceae bacterium]|jgi:D-amino-acid oxidase